MSTLDKPTMQMPIGRVTVGGREYPVSFSPEFFRQWVASFVRLGETYGTGTTDLAASAFEDAGIAEQLWLIQQFGDAGRQSPPAQLFEQVQEVQTQIAELRARVEELAQSVAGIAQEPV